ncbi:8778_t:CDS:1 [Ambispora leptoticha]|uniref:8778_t:CDS:1 n=1 Tax=Ambispora leptoticha TaxID=144679 RepID=A0A9N9BMW9_9GLOM|nr:8778_t:CDS:1 [Ambispora leptoticha]
MNKQIFFLVVLTILVLVISPINATAGRREKRATCPQIVDYCTFEPQAGNPNQIVLGQVTFTQFTDCTLRITGQFNTIHGSSNGYHLHIVTSPTAPPTADLDSIFGPQIDQPFEKTLPVSPIIPFTNFKNYLCVVKLLPGGLLGSTQVKQV